MSLDHLVHVHTSKREKAKHYSRQLTYSLALICLIFFGTIVTYQGTVMNMNSITGMMPNLNGAGIPKMPKQKSPEQIHRF